MVPVLGRAPGAYVPGTSFKYWRTMLENWFDIRQVQEEFKGRILINEMGGVAFMALEALLHGAIPKDKSYADLIKILETHYTPKLLTLGERFKLLSLVQREGQSLAEYYGTIAQTARTCKFSSVKDVEDTMIAMTFLKGLKNEETRVRLLEH